MEGSLNTETLQWLATRFEKLEKLVAERGPGFIDEPLIDQETLAEKLDCTVQHVISLRNKGKIPFVRVGSSPRYMYSKVIVALEKAKK